MADDLQQEVADVRTTLLGVVDGLDPALADFVRDEIERRETLDLAQIVLAAACPEKDTSGRRLRRIQLAAALELLTVALAIHKLLLLSPDRDGIDRSLAGGTVLVGDYCFSQAAVLAAQSENPQVVAIFSELLQQLSEGNLRRVFGEGGTAFSERTLLYRRGAQAGAVLAALPAEVVAHLAAYAEKLAEDVEQGAIDPTGIPAHQQLRWQAVVDTLAAMG